jgi:hypothetical protein
LDLGLAFVAHVGSLLDLSLPLIARVGSLLSLGLPLGAYVGPLLSLGLPLVANLGSLLDLGLPLIAHCAPVDLRPIGLALLHPGLLTGATLLAGSHSSLLALLSSRCPLDSLRPGSDAVHPHLSTAARLCPATAAGADLCVAAAATAASLLGMASAALLFLRVAILAAARRRGGRGADCQRGDACCEHNPDHNETPFVSTHQRRSIGPRSCGEMRFIGAQLHPSAPE